MRNVLLLCLVCVSCVAPSHKEFVKFASDVVESHKALYALHADEKRNASVAVIEAIDAVEKTSLESSTKAEIVKLIREKLGYISPISMNMVDLYTKAFAEWDKTIQAFKEK